MTTINIIHCPCGSTFTLTAIGYFVEENNWKSRREEMEELEKWEYTHFDHLSIGVNTFEVTCD